MFLYTISIDKSSGVDMREVWFTRLALNFLFGPILANRTLKFCPGSSILASLFLCGDYLIRFYLPPKGRTMPS